MVVQACPIFATLYKIPSIVNFVLDICLFSCFLFLLLEFDGFGQDEAA
jgi:hypothetical protein